MYIQEVLKGVYYTTGMYTGNTVHHNTILPVQISLLFPYDILLVLIIQIYIHITIYTIVVSIWRVYIDTVVLVYTYTVIHTIMVSISTVLIIKGYRILGVRYLDSIYNSTREYLEYTIREYDIIIDIQMYIIVYIYMYGWNHKDTGSQDQ